MDHRRIKLTAEADIQTFQLPGLFEKTGETRPGPHGGGLECVCSACGMVFAGGGSRRCEDGFGMLWAKSQMVWAKSPILWWI